MPKATPKRRSETADNVFHQGALAAKMLREMAEATDAPYLKPIAGISLLILDTIQTVKANKEECMRMTERTYELVCAIINIYQDSGADLSPAMIRSIGHLSETLEKILSFVRHQAAGSLIRRLVRHAENSSLLAECNTGLKHAHDVFVVQSNIIVSVAIAEIKRDADERHQELMKAISQREHSGHFSSSHILRRSSSSLSLIPASPQIFHGRETELESLTTALLRDEPARIAILGIGGIGKSTLALAALHAHEVVSKFGERRYFISCESANSPSALISIVAAYFGLQNDDKPAKAIVRYIMRQASPSVLVLDNFETPWEPLKTRPQVEEFLSLMSDIKNLDIMVTMRGAERPGSIRWTRPFLPPLRTLSALAARQVFFDISDPVDDDTGVIELLQFTDNLPLAVTLIANLASFEGCDSVLSRWKHEATSLLSDGLDRRSNLDISITLSLNSPRMLANPGSRELLSLLSLLPDGISEATLEGLDIPLSDIARCRVTLCRTSLALVDRDGRLKVLVPIRQYIRRNFPPSPALLRPLQSFMYDLVKPFESWHQSVVSALFQRVKDDLGNIYSLIEYALTVPDLDPKETVYGAIDLAEYTYITKLMQSDSFGLIRPLEGLVERLHDPNLQGRYLLAVMKICDQNNYPIEVWARKAVQCFDEVNDLSGQAAAYIQLAMHYKHVGNSLKGLETVRLGLALAEQAGDLHTQSLALAELATLADYQGLRHDALIAARKALSVSRESGNLFDEANALGREVDRLVSIGRDFRQASQACEDALRLLDAFGFDLGNSSHYRSHLRGRAEILLQKTEYADARDVFAAVVGDSSTSSIAEAAKGTTYMLFHQILSMMNIAHIDVATRVDGRSDDDIKRRLGIIRPLLATITDLRSACFCDITQGDLNFRRKEYGIAKSIFEHCLITTRVEFDDDAELSLLCYERLSDTERATDNMVSALRYSVVFLIVGVRTQSWPAIHQALRCLGDVLLKEGDEETAEALFNVALEGFTFMDIHRGRADCMLRIGDIWKLKSSPKAVGFWMAARPLFERSSQWCDVAECDARLATYAENQKEVLEQNDAVPPFEEERLAESLNSIMIY